MRQPRAVSAGRVRTVLVKRHHVLLARLIDHSGTVVAVEEERILRHVQRRAHGALVRPYRLRVTAATYVVGEGPADWRHASAGLYHGGATWQPSGVKAEEGERVLAGHAV